MSRHDVREIAMVEWRENNKGAIRERVCAYLHEGPGQGGAV